ncbi:hypothetical protein NHH03_03130 [Stieleria sp. TO1_6]|uniref:hypothetical protein n=1 Tax=Stieleria tagensis TaxID=2956795 RepID=UPI00209AC04E|nr:hypothetical protein [Stieleria tagensis]MCO8120716.1 hypothetical protein [Stieleria tagensis]
MVIFRLDRLQDRYQSIETYLDCRETGGLDGDGGACGEALGRFKSFVADAVKHSDSGICSGSVDPPECKNFRLSSAKLANSANKAVWYRLLMVEARQ